MDRYTNTRHNLLATGLVISLAALVSNGLALDQRLILERHLPAGPAAGATFELPEVVVTAKRIDA